MGTTRKRAAASETRADIQIKVIADLADLVLDLVRLKNQLKHVDLPGSCSLEVIAKEIGNIRRSIHSLRSELIEPPMLAIIKGVEIRLDPDPDSRPVEKKGSVKPEKQAPILRAKIEKSAAVPRIKGKAIITHLKHSGAGEASGPALKRPLRPRKESKGTSSTGPRKIP